MRRLLVIICLISPMASAQEVDSMGIMIGQMLMVGFNDTSFVDGEGIIADIQNRKIGGVIFFEKNIPRPNSYFEFKKITSFMQSVTEIPLFIAIDQEGGLVNRLKTKYGFPPSVTHQYLGETQNLDSTRFYAEMTAATLAGLGVNVNFAPVVDVNINPSNPVIGRFGRSFSASPDSVFLHARAFSSTHRRLKVIPVLKHFPGHGSSLADTHLGMADVTKTWQNSELIPYSKLIKEGAPAIMTAHIVNKKLDDEGLPSTLSKNVIQGILRDSLKFDGVVFTDDMQMHAITKHYGLQEAVKLSINAGVDVLIFSNNIQDSETRTAMKVHEMIMNMISLGEIPMERVKGSYLRIMKLKSGL